MKKLYHIVLLVLLTPLLLWSTDLDITKKPKGINLEQGITIYGYQRCPYCQKAYSFFNHKGIAFTNKDIRNCAKAKQEAENLGIRGVPVIYINGDKIIGYDKGEITKVLKKHDYL